MRTEHTIVFYPQKILWIGTAFLLACAGCGAALLWSLSLSEIPPARFSEKNGAKEELKPLTISLEAQEKIPFPIPEIRDELHFSIDPPRPDRALLETQIQVRLREGTHSKRVVLPARLDLQYEGDRLNFSKRASTFWLDLLKAGEREIEGRVFIETPEGKIDAGSFTASLQESPLQTFQEFPEKSPFRLLAESRWWGKDQFREQYQLGDSAERLEIGSELLELKEGEWLQFTEGSWKKIASLEGAENSPIARIEAASGRALFLEGWGPSGHARLLLNLASLGAGKTRGEDLLSAIRVRSEKQISCMLEKQCLILKTGDWVIKNEGRWKILRRKDEREAYLSGRLVGDLFVFEQIGTKGGQKTVQGHLFNPPRSQSIPIEIAAQSRTKSTKDLKPGRRGKV